MKYRRTEDILAKYTNNWTLEEGSYPASTKKNLEDIYTILSDQYTNVDKHHLDVDRNDIEGVDYRVEFSSPKDKMEESDNVDQLMYFDDKNPSVGPIGGAIAEDYDDLSSINLPVGEEKIKESIEKHEDTYGENMRSRIDLNAIPTYNSEKDAISAAKIEEIVRYFTNNDMPFAGVLVDAIAYQDTFKEKKISALVSTFDLNKKKLTDFVNSIDTSFAEYYSKKYKVKKEIIENLALNLKKSNSNRLNKLIQKTMYELKHNDFVKENLCY